MIPKLIIGNTVIYHGNNLDVLPELQDNSVDSIVCDPPYELGFMGKSWDSSGIAYSVELWQQCLRVLKPGGHLLAFGGTRTWHRLAVAIEDSGFEIRDNIAWLYGSGFPKSHNISKAIDKAAGAEREVVGQTMASPKGISQAEGRTDTAAGAYGGEAKLIDITVSATDDAKKWEGWGTALKPAHEPIVVARKPVEGTVAANVLKYGTGAINIDGTRIGREENDNSSAGSRTATFGTQETKSGGDGSGGWTQNDSGRFPANIILDETTAELLDQQAEASRFFYVAKASKKDRNEGLEDLEGQQIAAKGNGLARTCDTCKATVLDGCECPDRTFSNPVRQNFHPTVKPTALMQYLIRLVTPPNGLVLDPFTGSGSTGKAAILEGKRFIGIEMTEEYLPIIEGRLKHAYQIAEQDLYNL